MPPCLALSRFAPYGLSADRSFDPVLWRACFTQRILASCPYALLDPCPHAPCLALSRFRPYSLSADRSSAPGTLPRAEPSLPPFALVLSANPRHNFAQHGLIRPGLYPSAPYSTDNTTLPAAAVHTVLTPATQVRQPSSMTVPLNPIQIDCLRRPWQLHVMPCNAIPCSQP